MRRAWLLLLFACAHAPAAAPPGFGVSKEQAIEVCLPPGQKAYLAGLTCSADGSKPQHKRLGSIGARNTPLDPADPRPLLQMDPERPLQRGEPDFHIIDAVEVRCPGATWTLFFDMYHCPAREQPVPEGLR